MASRIIAFLSCFLLSLKDHGAVSMGISDIELAGTSCGTQTSPSYQFVIPAMIQPINNCEPSLPLPSFSNNFGNHPSGGPGFMPPMIINGGNDSSSSKNSLLFYLLLLSLKNNRSNGGFGGGFGGGLGGGSGCGGSNRGCVGFGGGNGNCGCGRNGGCGCSNNGGGCDNSGFGGNCYCGGGNGNCCCGNPYPYSSYADECPTVIYLQSPKEN